MSVLSTVFTTILCIVALAALAVAILTRISSNNDFSLAGHPALVVLSGSMTPTIDTGDLIVDAPSVGATDLHVGQIASFYDTPAHQAVVSHRIIAVIHKSGAVWYRTKGDDNAAADAALRPASDVLGVYQFKIPRAGYLLFNLRDPLVLWPLLAVPLLWVLAGALRRPRADLSNAKGGE
jgi:signal peptidase